MKELTFKDVAIMFSKLQEQGFTDKKIMEMFIGVEGLTFDKVAQMFNQLVEKGYTIEEIVPMPIYVGRKEETKCN